jgi:DNA primase
MNTWIDFRELRKQLDFAEVLRHYGVEVNLKGKQHHGFCPLPSHEGKRNSQSFSANVKRGIWQCFGCGGKGNVLDFAVLMEKANPENGEDVRRVAASLQAEFLGRSTLAKRQESEGEGKDDNAVINAPLDFELKGLAAGHAYFADRSFTADTVARFGLGYCSRGLLAGRIAIPLHDGAGKLIGYAGRLIEDSKISEESPKYRFPGRRKRREVVYDFRKSLFLYNGYRITGPVDDLVVLEGFTGLWWLSQAGIVNIVATMGASCSEEQAEAIVSLVSPSGRVWVFTDGDNAGARCAGEILVRVSPHRFVRWVRLTDGKQPTGFAPSELKSLFPF